MQFLYNGIKKLYLSEISGGHLLFDHNINGSLENYIEVKTNTLKKIIDENSLEKIDFLKWIVKALKVIF